MKLMTLSANVLTALTALLLGGNAMAVTPYNLEDPQVKGYMEVYKTLRTMAFHRDGCKGKGEGSRGLYFYASYPQDRTAQVNVDAYTEAGFNFYIAGDHEPMDSVIFSSDVLRI